MADYEKIEQRRMPEFCPQLPPVDCIDMTEQGGVAFAILLHELAELIEQCVVVQSVERKSGGHELVLSWVFETLGRALRRSTAAIVCCSRLVAIRRHFQERRVEATVGALGEAIWSTAPPQQRSTPGDRVFRDSRGREVCEAHHKPCG